MSQRIICKSCGDKLPPLHPEDAAMGFQRRTLKLRAKKPAVHETKIWSIQGNRRKLEEHQVHHTLICDDCGTPIPDGAECLAVTMWRGKELEPWEQDYGTVIK